MESLKRGRQGARNGKFNEENTRIKNRAPHCTRWRRPPVEREQNPDRSREFREFGIILNAIEINGCSSFVPFN